MEYEYSFNVNSIKEYINYCKSNDYKFIEKNYQTRVIYRKSDGTMARITTKNKKRIFLDFKEDKLTGSVLMKRKDTPDIEILNINNAKKILRFLGYKKDNTLSRMRQVYEKNGVKFEIDSYTIPRKTYVVAIEGISKEVDKVYDEVTKLYKHE
jgi:adenylate cyclase class IV